MSGWLANLLIVAANLVSGWMLVQLLAARSTHFDGDRLEYVFVCLTLGTAINGWFALLLAELGRFSIATLAIIWLVMLALVVLVLRRSGFKIEPQAYLPVQERNSPTGSDQVFPRRGRALLPPRAEALFLGLWLLVACWLFFRPHEFILGGADAGVYVNLGAEIAANGSILIQDDLLANLDPAHYPAFLRPIENPVAPYYILPAFYVIGAPAGEITPQFYPLLPVWQAVAYSLGGVRGALLSNGLWALLGTLAIYLLVRRLAGWEVAALAAVGLSLNALQVWFARYPTTEVLSQFVLWAGMWSLGAWLSQAKPRAIWALTAGLTMGQLFLVRIDALFVLPIYGLFGIWLWLRPDRPKRYWWFFGPLSLLLAHSLVHALWLSRPYFIELFGVAINLLMANWIILAIAAGAGVLFLWTALRYRDGLTLSASYEKTLLLVAIITVISLAAYGWFIRPNTTPVTPTRYDPYSNSMLPVPNDENLLRLGWYLSPIGVWLGVAGICLLIWRLNRMMILPLCVTAFYALFYLWRINANPHQIYAMRRYVPAVMPMFILATACFLGWLARQPNRWSMPFAALSALIWLGGLAWSARGFVSQVDFQGITSQFEALNDQLPSHSVLIFDEQAPVGVGDVVGTPMKFIYGHDVLKLRDPTVLDDSLMVRTIEAWQNKGQSVYWIGKSGWLSRNGLEYEEESFTLSARQLENSYDHKPRAINSIEFTLRLLRIDAP